MKQEKSALEIGIAMHERVSNGFPVEKAGDSVFEAYWDVAHALNQLSEKHFGGVKFFVTYDKETPVILKSVYRCRCGSEHHGEKASHSNKPRICADSLDSLVFSACFAHSAGTLVDFLRFNECHCLDDDLGDKIYACVHGYFNAKGQIYELINGSGNSKPTGILKGE